MSRFSTCEVVIRLSRERADGTRKIVEIGINPDETFDQILADAHCRADGARPTPDDVGRDAKRFSSALRLRDAEDELHADE